MQKVAEHIVSEINTSRIADYLLGVFDQLPTKNSIQKAIKSGGIRINDQACTTAKIPTPGDRIGYYSTKSRIKPYSLEIEIVYEDEHLLIANKPPGLPTSGNYFRTLEAALAHSHPLKFSESNLYSPRPAHRMDNLTSGLVIAAKTSKALFQTGQLFEKGKVHKTYNALVMGKTPNEGQWKSVINGKPAITTFKKLKEVRSLKNDHLTLLELSPKTGRTHQLRIHCSEAGFPIYGDPIYAEQTIKKKGLFLSAIRLVFTHPVTLVELDVSINLPSKFINRMKNEQNRWERRNGNSKSNSTAP